MTAAYLFTIPRARPLTDSGAIMPGAKLTFFDTGTTTKTDTYSDAALTTPNDNPVIADADGRFTVIYLDPSTTYRVQLHDADDQLIDDTDPYAPPRDEPAGTVKMFHGTAMGREAAYPSALWQLCDGTNGSPDMRDRMPIGAGVTYSSGETGGTNSATSGAAGGHDHGGASSGHALTEAEMAEHRHIGGPSNRAEAFLGSPDADVHSTPSWALAVREGGDQTVSRFYTTNTGGGNEHAHGIASVADHQHSVTVDPPRCGLWFLYKT